MTLLRRLVISSTRTVSSAPSAVLWMSRLGGVAVMPHRADALRGEGVPRAEERPPRSAANGRCRAPPRRASSPSRRTPRPTGRPSSSLVILRITGMQMSDFGVKSSQIKNILPNFGASTQRELCHIRKALAARRAPCALSREGASAHRIRSSAPTSPPASTTANTPTTTSTSRRRSSAPASRPASASNGMEKNRLVVGVDLLQDFGQHDGAREPFLTDARPLIDTTSFNDRERAGQRRVSSTARSCWATTPRRSSATRRRSTTTACRAFLGPLQVSTAAREDLRGDGDRLGGHVLRSSRAKCSASSRPDATRSSGGFYFGYAFSMFHFAGSKLDENVTDNLLVNPYAGWGVQRLLRLRRPGRAPLRPAARPQRGPRLEKTVRRTDRPACSPRWGVKTREQPLSGRKPATPAQHRGRRRHPRHLRTGRAVRRRAVLRHDRTCL